MRGPRCDGGSAGYLVGECAAGYLVGECVGAGYLVGDGLLVDNGGGAEYYGPDNRFVTINQSKLNICIEKLLNNLKMIRR